MHRNPLRHIQHLPVDDDPAVLLLVVLGHRGEVSEARRSCSTAAATTSGWRCSRAEFPLADQVLHVFLNGARLMDRVPLLGGILPDVGHDGLLTTRVDGDPLRHVKDLPIDDDPSIILRLVLSHLCHGHTCWRCRCSIAPATATVCHQVFDLLDELILAQVLQLFVRVLGTTLSFGILGNRTLRRRHTADDERPQVLDDGRVLALDELSHRQSSFTTRVDGMQEGNTGDAPDLLVGGCCDLSGSIETLNVLALGIQDLATTANQQAAGTRIQRPCHLARVQRTSSEELLQHLCLHLHLMRQSGRILVVIHDFLLHIELAEPHDLLGQLLCDDQAARLPRLCHRLLPHVLPV
mmetsp:Transcript_14612/g.31967  ORF Transcript_14612/g.31967 Transcript_14612/m.31967 type:complete len:351 (+) Transcript_14612:1151-2203(+)